MKYDIDGERQLYDRELKKPMNRTTNKMIAKFERPKAATELDGIANEATDLVSSEWMNDFIAMSAVERLTSATATAFRSREKCEWNVRLSIFCLRRRVNAGSLGVQMSSFDSRNGERCKLHPSEGIVLTEGGLQLLDAPEKTLLTFSAQMSRNLLTPFLNAILLLRREGRLETDDAVEESQDIE